MGITKTLTFDEINGHANLGKTALYPVTYTGAVFNKDGKNVDQLIEELSLKIKEASGEKEDTPSLEPIIYVMAFTGATDEQAALVKLNQMDTTNPPKKWYSSSNTPLAEGEILFMTTARSQGNTWLKWNSLPDIGKIWSTPIRIGASNTTSTTGVDGQGYNYVYCRTETFEVPSIPNQLKEKLDTLSDTNSFGINAETGFSSNAPTGVWYNHPMGISEDIPYEWVVAFFGRNNEYECITPTPILWSNFGLKGMDGDGIEYIFCLCPTEVNNPELLIDLDSAKDADDSVPKNALYPNDPEYQWTDDPLEVSDLCKVQYVSKRVKSNGHWGPYCIPTVWNRYVLGGLGVPGPKGDDAVVYSLKSNVTAVIKNAEEYAPSSITFTAYKTVGLITSVFTSYKNAEGYNQAVEIAVSRGNAVRFISSGASISISSIPGNDSSITALFTDPNGLTLTLTIPVTVISIPELNITNSVLRYIGNWDALIGYLNGIATIPYTFCSNYNTNNNDNTKYVDVVSRYDALGKNHYYKCTHSHNISINSTVENNAIPGIGEYWLSALELRFLHTEALIAEQIASSSISAKDLVILSEENEVVAGMTSSSPSKQTGLASSDVGDVRIWAGSTSNNNILEAPFRVTEEGQLTATDANIQGSIVATSLTAKAENNSSMTFRLWTEADNDKHYLDVTGSDITLDIDTPVLFVHDASGDKDYVVVLLQLYLPSQPDDLAWDATSFNVRLLSGDLSQMLYSEVQSIFADHSFPLHIYLCTDSKLNIKAANGLYYSNRSTYEPKTIEDAYFVFSTHQLNHYAVSYDVGMTDDSGNAVYPSTWDEWVANASRIHDVGELEKWEFLGDIPSKGDEPDSKMQLEIFLYYHIVKGVRKRCWAIRGISELVQNAIRKPDSFNTNDYEYIINLGSGQWVKKDVANILQ